MAVDVRDLLSSSDFDSPAQAHRSAEVISSQTIPEADQETSVVHLHAAHPTAWQFDPAASALPPRRLTSEAPHSAGSLTALDHAASAPVDDHAPKTSHELACIHASLTELRKRAGSSESSLPHLEDRIAHVESLLRSSCFSAKVTFEGRALQWAAAAKVLHEKVAQLRQSQGSKPGAELVQLQRRYNHCIEKARDFQAQAEASDPLAIHREGKQSPTGTKMPKSGKDEGNQQKAAIHFIKDALDETAPALREAGLSGGLKPKHLFKAALNEILSKRSNPVVRNPLCLPAAAGTTSAPGAKTDAKSKSAPDRMVVCIQTPAQKLSESMGATYHRDGLQGVLCHDDTEHRHASNLYRSELRDGKAGRSLLTLTRHGAISAFGLTREGIKTISDERLGRIVLDLGYHNNYSIEPGSPLDARGLAEVGDDFRRRAESRGGEDLLAHVRATASRKRAEEVAEAALGALPAQELERIQGEIRQGRTPTVRLASVSLLTPDSLREHDPRSGKYTANERLMWTDQLAAWKALEDYPGGVPCRLLQGEHGKPTPRIKFEIAAFDLPVNAGGVGKYSRLDAVSGHDILEPANRAAVDRLVGKLPDVRRLEDWTPKGWVGEALGRMNTGDPNYTATLTLAKQVAQLMVQGQHLRRADDPYILVRRLLVLSQLTGQVAPAVNCRSGKDRTSEAEAQARQLAFHIATTGEVPALDDHGKEIRTQDAADLRARQLWTLHQGGGSRQIQAWNTTYPGTKLKMAGLVQQYQMQDPTLFQEYIGQSEAAKE